MEKKPKICILRWEGGKVPEPLLNLENLPGNSTNPASYPFEIKYCSAISSPSFPKICFLSIILPPFYPLHSYIFITR